RRATRRGSPAAASPTTARQIERRPPSASRSAHAQQLLPQPLLHRHYAEPPLPHQGEVLEVGVRLDLRERDRSRKPLPHLHVHDDERIVVRLRVRVGVGHDARQPDDLLLIAGVVDHHGVALPHRAEVLQRDGVLHAIPHRAPIPLEIAEAVRRRLRLHDPVARHPHLARGLSTRRRGNTYGPSDPEAIPTGPDSNPWRPSPLTRAAYRGHPTGRDPPPRASGWAVRPRASVMPGSTDRSAIRTPALSRTAKWTAG